MQAQKNPTGEIGFSCFAPDGAGTTKTIDYKILRHGWRKCKQSEMGYTARVNLLAYSLQSSANAA
ncbi:hypothetical protein ED458_21540 [Salmonella enterica subsp. enterica serovar Kottbus]|nr:hypothetical protein [Salmonella enterica subsp. enterica serovar Takoradi]EBZ6487446.1 hypothetical protein [Salmonella enterica subsp. enterica serovar Kottbus]